MNTNLNSSENFRRMLSKSLEQNNSISASNAEPIRPEFLEDSIILLTSDLTLRTCCHSLSDIDPSEEQTQSSNHSDKCTDSRSEWYKRQASSAVKLSMGAIQRINASKIWNKVV